MRLTSPSFAKPPTPHNDNKSVHDVFAFLNEEPARHRLPHPQLDYAHSWRGEDYPCPLPAE